MIVPGSNILNMALGVIQPTPGAFVEEYLGEKENEFGKLVVTYGERTPLRLCSIQPLPKAKAQINGLDVNKSYITIWAVGNVKAAYRGHQGDRVSWCGQTYEVLPDSDWLVQDGWTKILAVKK